MISYLTEPTVLLVLAGTAVLGATAGVVGLFSYLRKRSLTGDAVAHAVLPGVCVAFLWSNEKDPLLLLCGATISGWLALLAIDLITTRSRIKPDSAIAVALSVFFGAGIVLLTYIQQSGNAAQSGLDSFLFGKAASMSINDLRVFVIAGVLIVLILLLLLKEFKLITFNRDYAVTAGLPVRLLEFILATLTVIAVSIGIQAAGVVLIAALLITPAAVSRFWSNRFGMVLFLAGLTGALSGMLGSVISLFAPSMPTGPWIVVVLSAIAFLSFLFAPGRGLLAVAKKRRSQKLRIQSENLVKALFQLGEKSGEQGSYHSFRDLQAKSGEADHTGPLSRLIKARLAERQDDRYRLTAAGVEEAARVVRLHRLWELYLTRRLSLPADHVHQDAELMEHIITPELEALLQQDLDYPSRDPHQSIIP